MGVLQRCKKYMMAHTTIAKVVSRISLERDLRRYFRTLTPGVVLDIGSKDAPYVSLIPHTKYVRLDVDENDHPDALTDAHELPYAPDSFDTIIATELLEHLHDPPRAVREMHRVLNMGGVCIASTRFMYRYHGDPQDYYRFTQDSLRLIFKDFSTVEVIHHGNRIQLLWEVIMGDSKVLRVLFLLITPLVARIHFKKTNYPCGFMVYARK